MRKNSEETKEQMSESAKKRCESADMAKTKGFKWMNKDGKRKMVPPQEVEAYLSEGWGFGYRVNIEA